MSKKIAFPKSLFLANILVKVVLVMLVISLFCIPICTDWYDAVSGQPPIETELNICFYTVIAFAFAAVWKLNALLAHISKQETFVEENVKALRIISWCCYAIAGVFLILAYLRPLAFIVAFAAAFFGLIMQVLKNVFAMAVELKDENDFTI